MGPGPRSRTTPSGYYCNTLTRELEAGIQRATIIHRWTPISAPEGGKDGAPALENAARLTLSLSPDGG